MKTSLSNPLPVDADEGHAPDLYVVAEHSIFDDDRAWLRAIEAVCAVDDEGLALQVRTKLETRDRAGVLARNALEASRGSHVPVFLNGSTEDAQRLGYQNVHWPEALIPSSPSSNTSEVSSGRRIYAASVHSPDAALRAERAGADFLVAGTIFDAGSKAAPGAGLDHLRAIVGATRLPVLAIGGITPDRVASCIVAGATGVAVVSAVLGAADIAAAIGTLREALEAARAQMEVV